MTLIRKTAPDREKKRENDSPRKQKTFYAVKKFQKV